MNTNNNADNTNVAIKNSKKERKEFYNKEFGLGFFTPGTQCVIQIDHVVDEEKIITVRELIKNGPNSYLVATGEMSELTGEQCYHISHVKRIVKQADGHIKIDTRDGHYDTKNGGKVFVSYRDEYFKQQHGGNYDPAMFKHPSQYRSWSFDQLTRFVVHDYLKFDQVYDQGKLVEMLLATNMVHVQESEGGWGMRIYTVNKKKFRKAVKRMLNKCLESPYKTQRKCDEEYEEMYARDMDAEWEREHGDDSVTHEVTNEHGYKQAMMEDPGDSSKNIEVCSSCLERYTNKGAGTQCDICDRVDAIHYDHHDDIY